MSRKPNSKRTRPKPNSSSLTRFGSGKCAVLNSLTLQTPGEDTDMLLMNSWTDLPTIGSDAISY